jgi:hypothetical protein
VYSSSLEHVGGLYTVFGGRASSMLASVAVLGAGMRRGTINTLQGTVFIVDQHVTQDARRTLRQKKQSIHHHAQDKLSPLCPTG